MELEALRQHMHRLSVYTLAAVTPQEIPVTIGITVSQLRVVWTFGFIFSGNHFN